MYRCVVCKVLQNSETQNILLDLNNLKDNFIRTPPFQTSKHQNCWTHFPSPALPAQHNSFNIQIICVYLYIKSIFFHIKVGDYILWGIRRCWLPYESVIHIRTAHSYSLGFNFLTHLWFWTRWHLITFPGKWH